MCAAERRLVRVPKRRRRSRPRSASPARRRAVTGAALEAPKTPARVTRPSHGPARKRRRVLFPLELGFAGVMVVVVLSGGVVRLVRSLIPPPQKTNLAISSQPAGATVFLADRFVGVTPLPSVSLLPGTHSLKVAKYGYRTWSQPVEVKAEPDVLRIRLLPVAAGRLLVSSSPAQAEVHLDGQKRGTTPLALDPVASGPHALRLTRPGYQPAAQQIVVQPHQELKVSVPLQFRGEELLAAQIAHNPKDLLSAVELLHLYIIGNKLDKAKSALVAAVRLAGTEGIEADAAARLEQEVRKAYSAEYDLGGEQALEPVRRMLEAGLGEAAFSAGPSVPPGSTQAGLLLASLFDGAGNLQGARATYERLLAARPGELDVKRAYGTLLFRLQLMEQAAKELAEVAQARLNDAQVYGLLGAAYLHLKKPEDALRVFLHEVDIAGLAPPERINAETQIAAIFHGQGKFAQAADRWEKAWPVAETPDLKAELQLAAAAEHKLAGNKTRASELYNQILAGPAAQALKDRAKAGLNG